MFIKDAWYIAGRPEDFNNETPTKRWIIGKPLALFRASDGQVVALSDRCPHRQAPLSGGKITDDKLACPYHGHQFGSDGQCKLIPFNKKIPSSYKVPTYTVIEKYGFVWVWMGDKEQCDESQLPNYFETLDDSSFNWVIFEDQVDADYQLLNDNILDLTHVPYIHSIIGDSPLEEMELQVDKTDRTVTVQRESKTIRPGEFMISAGVPEKARIKGRWDFTAPCYAAGNIAYFTAENGSSDKIGNWDVRLAHIPTVAGQCIIYGMIGADFLPPNQHTEDFLRNTFHTTLNEDKVMCEDVQALIDTDPNFQEISVKTDAGGLAGRRIIDKIIAAEAVAAE